MSILTRHLVSRVLVGVGLVALAVTAILTLVDLIDEARRVGPGGYSFADALWVIVLTMPQRFYEVLPVSVFIGSLLSLGQFAADNEMTALRASGVGIGWLSGRLFAVGLLLALATIFIGEKIAPAGVEEAWNIRHQPQAESPSPAREAQGLWVRKGDHYLHMLRGARRDRLAQVLAYRLDADGALEHSLHAKSAHLVGGRWVLYEVRESVIHPDGSVTREQHAVRTDIVLPGVDVLDTMMMPADEMPVARLTRYLSYFEGERVDLRPYRFAWWQRFATPLACVVVLLLTVSFAFTQSRGGGLGQRIFIGVISGIGIYLFNRVGGHLGLLAGLPAGLGGIPAAGAAFPAGLRGAAGAAGELAPGPEKGVDPGFSPSRPGGWRSTGRASTAGLQSNRLHRKPSPRQPQDRTAARLRMMAAPQPILCPFAASMRTRQARMPTVALRARQDSTK